jgi:hypothetical protein
LIALCPVLALRTTVIVETRLSRPKTRSQIPIRSASIVSSISRKTAPSLLTSGASASSLGSIMRRQASGASASSYSAKVRPVLNGGSR